MPPFDRPLLCLPHQEAAQRRFRPESIIREAPPPPPPCNPYRSRGFLFPARQCCAIKEETDRAQSIANITLQRIQNFHRTEGHDRLLRGAVDGLRHALRAIQTRAFSCRPPHNKKPRGCGGRSPRRSVERVCSSGTLTAGQAFQLGSRGSPSIQR